jgi:hypothetical protein
MATLGALSYSHKRGISSTYRSFHCPTSLGSFQEHLSPHQFGVLTLGCYETILFGNRTFFDLHLDWVKMQVNAKNDFNIVS